MKYSKSATKTAIAVVFFSALIFGAGFYYGNVHEQEYGDNARTTLQGEDPQSRVDMAPFWKAWRMLEEKYVPNTGTGTPADISDQDQVWGAISGLTRSLDDPYTTFLPPTENEVFEGNIQGEFGGVGMEVGVRDDVLTVISPLPETPAKEAGLEPGDRILSVNGTSTQGMSVERAVQLIRGEKGTDVTLTILSEGAQQPKEVSITRSTIQIPTIETELRDDVFIISLYNFSAQSPNKFHNALQEFTSSDSDDLIIDLRGNAGGFLQAAVEVSSWFLESGKVIVRENFGDKREPREHRSKGYDIFANDDIDVVVLVNGGTASAAEIVAGALQAHDVATLVGSNTFGKGSVQELVELTPETAMKITVARWLTPDGSSISDGGLTPDVVVEPASATSSEEVDPQLERAIEIISDTNN